MRTLSPPAAAVALVVAAGLVAGVPAAATPTRYADGSAITIPAGAPATTAGTAAPYPSTLVVEGTSGPVTDVDVRLDGVTHTRPDDLDVLLVAPSGVSTVLMSDACGGRDVADVTWTFDDDAADAVPDAPAEPCQESSYRPSQYDAASDTWPAAYPGPHGTTLARFDGQDPRGTWRLYVRDDAIGDVGTIAGGWELTITTGPADTTIPASGTVGAADPYPRRVAVAAAGVVTDVDAVLDGVTHSHPDDLDVLLVSPSGQGVLLVSDACGSEDVVDRRWRFDDEATAPMPDADPCPDGTYRPTNVGAEAMAPPAPGPPYGDALSAFDQQLARGTWSLFVQDDSTDDAGFLLRPPTLDVTTRPLAATGFGTASVSVPEGATGSLTVTRSASTALLAATVHVTSSAGTADQADFLPIDVTLGFAPGQVEQVVPFTTLVDGRPEAPEAFTVTLDAPTGDAALGATATATVTVGPPPPPDTTLTKGPKQRTTSRRARIGFTSSVAGSTYECKVDRRSWRSCGSPLRLKELKPGRHKVRIRATAGGVAEVAPLVVRWTVER